jgi:creatinine amidohydrolase
VHDGTGIIDILGDHADERETALMMHLHPDLVLPKSEWGSGEANPWKLKAMREKWAWAQRAWTQATNDTGSGDPQHATAEKGQVYFEAITTKLATYFVELAAADPKALYHRG